MRIYTGDDKEKPVPPLIAPFSPGSIRRYYFCGACGRTLDCYGQRECKACGQRILWW